MLNKITITGFADEIDKNLDIQMKVLKKLGISHIEMRGVDGKTLTDCSDTEAREIRKRLDANGFSLSAIGSPIGKIEIDDDFGPHMELLKHTCEIAHIMNTGRIRMFSFYMPDGKDPSLYRAKVMEQTGEMIGLAEKEDVLLLHENEKKIYGDNAARCLDLMKAFYGPHYKCVFDFANFVQCGQDTLEAYDMLEPYITYVHIKDALMKDGSVVPAGTGDGHVKEILTKLDRKGYEGFLSIEPHLTDFTGFSNLEGGKKMEKKLTGEEAFTLAYESLEKILNI